MENLKAIKKALEGCIMAQTTDLKNVDADEFGKAADALKDITMAMYYCSVAKAMEESGEQPEETMYYTPRRRMMRYYDPSRMDGEGTEGTTYLRDVDMTQGRMYYTPMTNSVLHQNDMSRYDRARRYYTEHKNMNPTDDTGNTEKLKKWMDEVRTDIMGLVKDMTPEEKKSVREKVMSLAEIV